MLLLELLLLLLLELLVRLRFEGDLIDVCCLDLTEEAAEADPGAIGGFPDSDVPALLVLAGTGLAFCPKAIAEDEAAVGFLEPEARLGVFEPGVRFDAGAAAVDVWETGDVLGARVGRVDADEVVELVALVVKRMDDGSFEAADEFLLLLVVAFAREVLVLRIELSGGGGGGDLIEMITALSSSALFFLLLFWLELILLNIFNFSSQKKNFFLLFSKIAKVNKDFFFLGENKLFEEIEAKASLNMNLPKNKFAQVFIKLLIFSKNSK